MAEILVQIIMWISKIHDKIMTWNDASRQLTDKQLHFLIIGGMGLCMVFVIYPIFKALAKRNHIMTVTWVYVFTLVLVITLAIEVGQGITGSGQMEFMDMMSGVVGFLVLFVLFALIRCIYHGIKKLIAMSKRKRKSGNMGM